jgi:C-terminal processing protease CtpA/Prc
MVKQFYLLAFCVFCVLAGNAQSDLFTKKYSADQLKSDFQILVSDLKACHPGLYEYVSEEKLDSLALSIETGLADSLTQQEFYVQIRQFLSVVGCGHTSAAPAKKSFLALKGKASVIPVHVFLLDDELYLRTAFDEGLDSLIGAKILSIDGFQTEEVLAKIKSTISRDGIAETMQKRYIERMFQTYYLLIYGMRETYKLELESKEGIIVNLTVQGKAPKRYAYHGKHDLIDEIEGKSAKFGFVDSLRKVAVLDLNSFPSGKFRKFYRKSFKQLAENGSETLIIDLRGNGGGYFPNGNMLLRHIMNEKFSMDFDRPRNQPKRSKYVKPDFPGRMTRSVFFSIPDRNKEDPDRNYKIGFKPIKKDHFNGQVFILTDGYTFSASSFVTSKLKNARNAIVVGEETGGGEVGFNAVLKWHLLLPNTKIRVTLPMYHVDIQPTMNDKGRGVIPTIPVQYATFEQRATGIDLEMQKVLELLKEN